MTDFLTIIGQALAFGLVFGVIIYCIILWMDDMRMAWREWKSARYSKADRWYDHYS